MIATLRGKITQIDPPFLVIEVMGVGYEVCSPISSLQKFQENEGKEATILIVQIIREDSNDLYGFASKQEKNLFKTLIKVNGIGPKIAIGILSAADDIEFISNINNANLESLVKLPGIGKKTAQRLIIELKDKFISSHKIDTTKTLLNVEQEAISALTNLGFKLAVARKMLENLDTKNLSTDEIIRLALKNK
jgi:holliday junction DNA helicase RuvA